MSAKYEQFKKILSPPLFTQAIIHVDGDAFFASCEIAKNPALKGKCVVTGREKGIATAISYEAKARGVTRGMMIGEIKKICPEVILIESNYELYRIYSERMYAIVRRYTPYVEEYSVDECFAQITPMRESLGMSYEEIAYSIKRDLEYDLGMTFSLGMASTKCLAKVASKWHKPAGFTIISDQEIKTFLKDIPIAKIWGIGPRTTSYLMKQGLKTALDFTEKPEWWIKEQLPKPYQEIWYELQGIPIHDVNAGSQEENKSLRKTKTFSPPTHNKKYVFSELSKNIEHACTKLRLRDIEAQEFSFFLKTQQFTYHGKEFKLNHPVSNPLDIIHAVKPLFEQAFKSGVQYRATGIICKKITPKQETQLDLFNFQTSIKKNSKVYEKIDELTRKNGHQVVFLASSMQALLNNSMHSFHTETFIEQLERLLSIPFLGEAR